MNSTTPLILLFLSLALIQPSRTIGPGTTDLSTGTITDWFYLDTTPVTATDTCPYISLWIGKLSVTKTYLDWQGSSRAKITIYVTIKDMDTGDKVEIWINNKLVVTATGSEFSGSDVCGGVFNDPTFVVSGEFDITKGSNIELKAIPVMGSFSTGAMLSKITFQNAPIPVVPPPTPSKAGMICGIIFGVLFVILLGVYFRKEENREKFLEKSGECWSWVKDSCRSCREKCKKDEPEPQKLSNTSNVSDTSVIQDHKPESHDHHHHHEEGHNQQPTTIQIIVVQQQPTPQHYGYQQPMYQQLGVPGQPDYQQAMIQQPGGPGQQMYQQPPYNPQQQLTYSPEGYQQQPGQLGNYMQPGLMQQPGLQQPVYQQTDIQVTVQPGEQHGQRAVQPEGFLQPVGQQQGSFLQPFQN